MEVIRFLEKCNLLTVRWKRSKTAINVSYIAIRFRELIKEYFSGKFTKILFRIGPKGILIEDPSICSCIPWLKLIKNWWDGQLNHFYKNFSRKRRKFLGAVSRRPESRVPEGSLFDCLLHQCVGEGATPFPGLLHFTLDPYLIMLSVKQGGIKYHFLSLWYDSTWDWTQVSRAIGEHSNR